MRHSNPASILTPGDSEPEVGLQPGGDDFIDRINLTITNFKDLLALVVRLKGDTGGFSMENNPQEHPPPHGKAPGIAEIVQKAIQAGYGDIPIGKLIEQMSPFTLKQVLEVVKNAGFKR